MSKNGVISGPYFPVFGLKTEKYGPEVIPYLDTFHAVMEKANVVLVHEDGDKQCLKNYGQVSLLAICEKILERLIFNEMFRFVIESNLISLNQSGFKP